MQFDYNYLCNGLGHLTGLETRIYKNNLLLERYSNVTFDPDISGLIYNDIRSHKENAFYIETEDLLIFGVIKSKKDHILMILGPTSQIRPDKQTEISILHTLNEPYERLSELENYFNEMAPYPFENFLEIICFINYAINGEKLSVSQILQKKEVLPFSYKKDLKETKELFSENPHNTFQSEKMMLSYVTNGNVNAIRQFFTAPPTGRIGSIAHNELRQRKNSFVCAATLISRAAIAGGLPSESAFALSDRYIQKAELLSSAGDITNLNMEMLLDYTKRVETLKCGGNNSPFVKQVMRYILKHIDEKITTSDIAVHLKKNRTHLCEQFKKEAGITLNDFITTSKIEESKRLLSVTSLSIAQISSYLSFSTQSYFQTVFKRQVKMTPKEYRITMQTEESCL